MAQLARKRGALYFRYSDDILLVCNPEHRDELTRALENVMSVVKLTLHDGLGKRSVCNFTRQNGEMLGCDSPLQYLGFSFDGDNVRIRSQTLAKFYRRMRKAVRREKYLAYHRTHDGRDARVRRKQLYSRYTHLGPKNFVTGYAADAKALFQDNAIGVQLRSHWRKLHDALQADD